MHQTDGQHEHRLARRSQRCHGVGVRRTHWIGIHRKPPQTGSALGWRSAQSCGRPPASSMEVRTAPSWKASPAGAVYYPSTAPDTSWASTTTPTFCAAPAVTRCSLKLPRCSAAVPSSFGGWSSLTQAVANALSGRSASTTSSMKQPEMTQESGTRISKLGRKYVKTGSSSAPFGASIFSTRPPLTCKVQERNAPCRSR